MEAMRVVGNDGHTHALSRLEAVQYRAGNTSYTRCSQRVTPTASPSPGSVDCERCIATLKTLGKY